MRIATHTYLVIPRPAQRMAHTRRLGHRDFRWFLKHKRIGLTGRGHMYQRTCQLRAERRQRFKTIRQQRRQRQATTLHKHQYRS